jgi:hypothetical protein
MAGGVIHLRDDLCDQPEVYGLVARLGLGTDAVVGKVVRFWCWVNRMRRGTIPHVDEAFVDALVNHQGFTRALISVGWLVIGDDHLVIPKHAKWFRVAATGEPGDPVTSASPIFDIDISIKKKTKKKTNTEIHTPVFGEAFTSWWEAYPRKENKKDAVAAWNRLTPTSELAEKVLRALAAQKEQWRAEARERRYIPYPATWLNKRRWEDDLFGGEDYGKGAGGPGPGVRRPGRIEPPAGKYANVGTVIKLQDAAPAQGPREAPPAGQGAEPGRD